MKNHTIPMKATGTMTKNAKALTMQASLKAAEMNADAYRNVTKPNKKWSKLPTAPHVTPFAEGLVHAVMDRQDLYSVRRVGEREFEVKCSICVEPFIADHSVSEDKCPIPRFHRIRRVVVDDDGVCRCSCCYFEQVGIPCPHMAKCLILCSRSGTDFLPQFNDVCRVCEQFPQLRQKLSEAHEDILKHGRKLASEKMSNPERNGATVSMLTDRHTGPSRVYNTKINPI